MIVALDPLRKSGAGRPFVGMGLQQGETGDADVELDEGGVGVRAEVAAEGSSRPEEGGGEAAVGDDEAARLLFGKGGTDGGASADARDETDR